MSIESDLKKEGIEIVSKFDTLKVNTIAKNIAQKLVRAFPEYNFKLGELFIRLSKLNMYQVKVTKGNAQASYHYKNTSIYFNEKTPFSKITDYALHECIHYLQERKDKQGHLIRLGLCDLTQFKLHGLGMNEAAVQLATAKAFEGKEEQVTYYGITFPTTSPTYYPLECNLISQMAYFTGEYALFDSTFHSNNSFKDKFVALTDERTFYALEKTFDSILDCEDNLDKLETMLEQEDNVSHSQRIKKKIEEEKKRIANIYFEAQNLMLTRYFTKQFDLISNLEEVENYRRKLYQYKNRIGTTDSYHFFNDFYLKMMQKLEAKYLQLENGEYDDIKQDLAITKTSQWTRIIRIIKKILFGSSEEYKKIDDK